MDYNLISTLFTLGGVVASIASAIAIVNTKVSHLEKEFELDESLRVALKDEHTAYNVKITALEVTQRNHDRELNEMKDDLKDIKSSIQEVKEIVLRANKKGEA